MYTSNKTNHYFLKYLTVVFAIIWLIPFGNWLFNPNFLITVNGVKENASIYNIWPFAMLSCLFGLMYFFIARKLKIITFNSGEIYIGEWNNFKRFDWKEVESIKQNRILFPPLYKLKLKNNESVYFFTGNKCLILPFYVIDFSELGEFIKQKDKDLELYR